ncbi:MAG: substrate-binding domain-containing protein, partial [Hoeflea sp.]|nr:substrate-binding domain-containing protein [Hoeflea sp.]
RQMSGAPFSVVLDSREAARKATEYLVSLGHRRIGHLGGRPGGFNAAERLAGYRTALDAAGIPFDPALVTMGDYTFGAGRKAVRELVRTDATAIMAATLVSAAGAMAELRLAGWQLPEEMSVIALHDADFAEMLFPALSTVMMPTEEMGRVAADLLIRKLAGGNPEPVRALPPGSLMIRDSTVAPRPGAPRSK